MFALVVLETAAIALLAVLVAGLLRSHAEILRQLHHLGVNLDPDQGVSITPTRSAGRAAASVQGQTPDGDLVTIALDRPGERTLLLFLSTGCTTCAPLWQGLGRHGHAVPGARTVVVTRGPDEESPGALQGRAPTDVTVVMSSEAWESFSVPGSPYAVLVESGRVAGQGVSHGWEQLGSLVGQHLADVAARRGTRDQDRPETVDEQLIAAGIHPGHPSLYPGPRA